MKKLIVFLLLLCMLVMNICAVHVYGDGSRIVIGDDSNALIFSGSASDHYLILSSNGVVTAWGNNQSGQCGTTPAETAGYTDIVFDTESKIVKVSAGNNFSMALDQDGIVWGWGANFRYQLGISNPTDSGHYPNYFTTPTQCGFGAVDIGAGTDFSAILTENGNVYLNGNNHTHQKVNFPNDAKIKAISVKDRHILALGDDQSLYSWMFRSSPEFVCNFAGKDIVSISAGAEHGAIAVRADGDIMIYTFGKNTNYQLGIGDPALTQHEPVCVLAIPNADEQTVVLNTGMYSTFINVFDSLASDQAVDEYCFGTGCYYTDTDIDGYTIYEDNFDANVLKEPTRRRVAHCVFAAGNQKTLAYRVDDAVEIFGNGENPVVKHIIEPESETETMYPYQYKNIAYETIDVNFIKMNADGFQQENAAKNEDTGAIREKYAYWEYVNEKQCRVKIKDFLTSSGTIRLNPGLGIVRLGTMTTGENRSIGRVAAEIWNFTSYDEKFTTTKTEVLHTQEDGVTLDVTAKIVNPHMSRDLIIPGETAVFYDAPGDITENTRLGLYIYGLPKGTSAKVSDISGNTFKITLTGNSHADLDYDTAIQICYLYKEGPYDADGVVGDYDLHHTTIKAAKTELKGFTIQSTENTPENMTISADLVKGRENGKTIDVQLAGGMFSEILQAENWQIRGIEGLTVSSVERIDDTNARITIAGTAGDRYKNGEIMVWCSGEEYSDSRIYNEETGICEEAPLLSNPIIIKGQTRGGGISSGRTISRPTASIGTGAVVPGTKIALTCSVPGAKIFYTTDGSVPTEASIPYREPIEITEDTTIKFIAVAGTGKSAVQTEVYRIKTAAVKLKKNAEEIRYIKADKPMFHPDEAMPRYEIVEAILLLFDVEDVGTVCDFTDVAEGYKDAVSLLAGAGLIKGYPDKTFQGEKGITRAEFVRIFSGILKEEETEKEEAFSDIAGHWCEENIKHFTRLGYIKGYPDKTFRPDEIVTRAEAVTMLNRFAGKPAKDAGKKCFADVNDSHWAYKDIYAAVQEQKE